MNYYIADGTTQRGPFPPEQLLGQGLRADSLVWAEGMAQWGRADAVPELRAVLRLPPVGPVGPAPIPVQPAYATPPQYGAPAAYPSASDIQSKKMAAGLCAIFLGTFGVHKFILGMPAAGVTMLLITLCTCGLAAPIMHIIGIIEGIMYLTKSDPEFYQLYMAERKQWF